MVVAVAGIVPEGPLHPKLFVIGIVAGVAAAVVAGRSNGRWLVSTLGAVGVVVTAAQGDVLVGGVVDRTDRGFVVAVTLAVIVAAMATRPRWSTAAISALGACAGVWAIVPDTEVPLLVAATLAGASVVRCLPGWLPDRRSLANGVLVVLPLAGAVAGSIGRPSRYGPALAVGALTALLALSAWGLLVLSRRRQRAGTPTTVAPGSTSSMTTAPAPTTAF
ncbi:MAG: hypothetical protein R2707_01715 [Acidimicrobiales bacterium]